MKTRISRFGVACGALSVAVLSGGCSLFRSRIEYAAPQPPEGYALIDVYEAGRPDDYVKFHNQGLCVASVDILVQYHSPKTRAWLPYGASHLKGVGDTDTMKHSTDIGGGLSKIRYFAVKFSDGKKHTLRLDERHDDLHVYVMD